MHFSSGSCYILMQCNLHTYLPYNESILRFERNRQNENVYFKKRKFSCLMFGNIGCATEQEEMLNSSQKKEQTQWTIKS